MSAEPSPAPSTRLTAAWIGLVILALLTSAALGYLWWTGRPPAEGDPAVTFARDMAAHHRQAVEMATLMRDRTQDPGLRLVELDIILTQQDQIGQMQGWLQVWGLPLNGPQPPLSDHTSHPDMPVNMGLATPAEVQSLSSLPVPDADIQFLKLMIRHHQGGIYMANLAHQATRRPEVDQLARAIIVSQEKEIENMQAMLAQRGVTVTP